MKNELYNFVLQNYITQRKKVKSASHKYKIIKIKNKLYNK